jgi:AcrR family transcriptional regulator
MTRGSSQSVQRAFPRRETLLAALRQQPQMKPACEAAGISRNTAYTHLRKDARFRRQWEHVVDQGREAAYRLHLKKLATDPQYLRTLERLRLAYGSEGRPFLMWKNLVG